MKTERITDHWLETMKRVDTVCILVGMAYVGLGFVLFVVL